MYSMHITSSKTNRTRNIIITVINDSVSHRHSALRQKFLLDDKMTNASLACFSPLSTQLTFASAGWSLSSFIQKLRQIYIKFLWGRNNTLCDVLITEFIFTCKNVLDIRSRIPYYGKLWVTIRVYRNLIQDYTDINMHCQRRLRSALPECPLVKQWHKYTSLKKVKL